MFQMIPAEKFEDLVRLALTPWNVENIPWDYQSFVLVAIGLSFGLFSILDGYIFDDKYPGYGSAARKNSAASKVEKSYTKLINKIFCIKKYNKKKLDKTKDKLLSDIIDWDSYTNEYQNDIANYQTEIKNANEIYDHIIRHYITRNTKLRPNKYKKIPARFEKVISDESLKCFKYDAEVDPQRAFESSYDVYLDDEQRKTKTINLREIVKKSYSEINEKILAFSNAEVEK